MVSFFHVSHSHIRLLSFLFCKLEHEIRTHGVADPACDTLAFVNDNELIAPVIEGVTEFKCLLRTVFDAQSALFASV
ncbi:hypothetical protein SDC9_137902 [bioreactor metagenome]|uniref:Uncharacterized protein n=1 Tax=bioreactor metagenome TaxID=1076179 RepID=A0A645DMV7_9ZZZZ